MEIHGGNTENIKSALCGLNATSLTNQNSSDTNMQSCTESTVAVPINVRGCSSIDKRDRAERHETGNFLPILSNISSNPS